MSIPLRRLPLAYLVVAGAAGSAAAEETASPDAAPRYDRSLQQIETTWRKGQPELYLPLYTYHMRFAYTRQKIDSFNECRWRPWNSANSRSIPPMCRAAAASATSCSSGARSGSEPWAGT